jgi:hypothetical protein
MQFRVRIDMGNEAMQSPQDVAWALRNLAHLIDPYTDWRTFHSDERVGDINGNAVGSWTIDKRSSETINSETRYTLDDLECRTTLSEGQFGNLKIETEGFRVWLSRMHVADGAEYENGVTVEHLINGSWVTINEYEAI